MILALSKLKALADDKYKQAETEKFVHDSQYTKLWEKEKMLVIWLLPFFPKCFQMASCPDP